jgi:glycosyltransferase involved in cell wall biosynthesis
MGFPVHVATAPLLSHWGRKPFNVVGDSEPEPLEDLKAPDFEAMPTKISLLHATRGRPEKSDAARRLWLERSSGRHEIEYIVSIDDDDELMDAVDDIPCDRLIIGKNRGNVDAYNAAYKEATGSILIQMHDDVVPPFHWDRKVANRIGSTKHAVLRVSDGQTCNPHNPGLLTVLIGTKDYFDSLGYFYYPEYVSIYCDDDITCKAERDGVIIEAQDIRFKHAWHGGDDDADETYKRSYRDENWKIGRAIIERRFTDDFKK